MAKNVLKAEQRIGHRDELVEVQQKDMFRYLTKLLAVVGDNRDGGKTLVFVDHHDIYMGFESGATLKTIKKLREKYEKEGFVFQYALADQATEEMEAKEPVTSE